MVKVQNTISASGRPRSTVRLLTFKIITVLTPVIFLLVAETVLVFFDYGKNLKVFVDAPHKKDYLILNPVVSNRYFTNSDNATNGNQEPFKKVKDQGTFRIFVLGESTTIGYPYMHNGSFHRWLKYRLMHTFPDIDFEVINLSMTAVNSYTVLDFAQELPGYNPDAVMVYTGHNEYYGALGVGSTGFAGYSPRTIHFFISCRKVRFVQLITNLWKATTGFFSNSSTNLRENLMKRMVADQKIELNSEVYNGGITQFETNMTQLCALFSKHHIPVFISDLVSNEKDLKPFVSSSIGLDTSAEKQFLLGNIAYKSGDFRAAGEYFVKAKELDLLRFRAPEAINSIIGKFTGQFSNVHLVKTNDLFRHHSPHGILDNTTLLEHVHPNLFGYSLLSESFYQAFKASRILPFNRVKEWSLKHLRKEMPITKVDSLKGQYEMMILMEGWPFNEQMSEDDSRPKTLEEQLAGGLAVRQISWRGAMERLLGQYSMERNIGASLRVVEALILEYPQELKWYDHAGKFSLALNDLDKAIFYIKKAYNIEDSFERAQSLFVMLLKQDKPNEAMPYLRYASSHNPIKVSLVELEKLVGELIILRNRLENGDKNPQLISQIASIYLKFGNTHAAKKYVDLSLRLDSTNFDSQRLKHQVK
jgi:tetratricopeptide (TPR) repeat protein